MADSFVYFMQDFFLQVQGRNQTFENDGVMGGTEICDPTPANEVLCGKINFELWAKM